MRSLAPVPASPPPLSRRERFVLLLLLPLWLPFFVLGIAVLVVGLLFAPDPPVDVAPAPDDDDLPDDYVSPFMPPGRRPRPVKGLPPRRITIVPAPPAITSTTATPTAPDELDQIPVSSWPGRFPGG